MKSTLLNMVVVLCTITLIASASVGGVFVLTKESIAEAQQKKVNDAISMVMPGFDNTPSTDAITQTVDGETIRIYPATKSGTPIGYAIETFSKNGFGGKINLMVGFLPDGSISDVSVISHNETPGLGDKIERKKSNFSLQFEGKNPETFKLAVKKDGGDVDAITASTITSRAYADALDRAYKVFQQIKK